ncbi:MAG: PQQ-dependent sugar dehydrogenase [Chloroflexi bacterium]|nr:PQQ-dependent sugar dehydrogenase [Chloroflexota bacterium]
MALEPAFPHLPPMPQVLDLKHPPGDTSRLFAVVRPGQIFAFPNDPAASSATIFLDIRSKVATGGQEEGLLGLAFDSDYPRNGYFYVYYSVSPPRRSVLSRFSVRRDDPERAEPTSELVLMEIPQPFANHNGGGLLFGPDGMLYLGLGDGGSARDPSGNGQNLSTLLGSLLRIDVRNASAQQPYAIPPDNPFVGRAGARAEIWAYGLRNPWRFSFDKATGQLWVADVGQDRYEEINVVRQGGNYGWNVMEGAHCFPETRSCDRSGLALPVFEYDHSRGCSITGGYVYRGKRLPTLQGAYIYSDYCSGRVWALRHDGARVTEQRELVDSPNQISSFGEDADGELYLLSFGDGRIYRLTPRE